MDELDPLQNSRLVVFAKAPVPGKVKTRLQPIYSTQQSARIHQWLVKHCLETVSKISNLTIELWIAGEHSDWQQHQNNYGVEIYRQQGNDLGERMSYAAHDALTRSDKVAIIGTDCPFISCEYLHNVYKQLNNECPVVIGPAADGGYVLIAMTQVYSFLFDNMPWGEDQVLNNTRQRLEQYSVNYHQMNELNDIDRPDDVDLIKNKIDFL